MLFIMGITGGRKDFDFQQFMICSVCGRYGRYQVFMTYTVLSLFFLPVLKWNRHYYVQTSCCGAVYELEPEIGKMIAAGKEIEIQSGHLTKVQSGSSFAYGYKRCRKCGYETAEDFEYCPKCGERF